MMFLYIELILKNIENFRSSFVELYRERTCSKLVKVSLYVLKLISL